MKNNGCGTAIGLFVVIVLVAIVAIGLLFVGNSVVNRPPVTTPTVDPRDAQISEMQTQIAQMASGQPAPTIPGAVPTPAGVVVPASGCEDNNTTNFGPRNPVTITVLDGEVEEDVFRQELEQVRNEKCMRLAWLSIETGVAVGRNFRLEIPDKWSVAISAVSCQVVEDGGSPVDYTNAPYIVIRGPWIGSAGCYEAGVCQ